VQDPAAHIRSLIAEDHRDEAVAFWMSDVVHLPAEVLAGMRNMPWLKALEPLTPTLPYDIFVTDGGVPAAELAAISSTGTTTTRRQRSLPRSCSVSSANTRLTRCLYVRYDHFARPRVDYESKGACG
jgi:hypothetical protein